MNLINTILGRRLPTSAKEGEKIGVFAGISAMGLDALSSAAYGPEAALTILLPLSVAGLAYIGPITLVILAVLAMVYFSYRQTIAAYPTNGGSYTVAKENLGATAGLFAAAALMIDYVLNVAVGISAGVAALISAAPKLHPYTLPLCLAFLALITLMNLRGTGEAGLAFALPTYTFIVSLLGVLVVGVVRALLAGGHPHPVLTPPVIPAATSAASVWLLLRAFASGCTAMTGVEAVSNGVAAFKDPTVKNAHRTLTVIIAVLALMLGGVAFLSRAYGIGAMAQTGPGYQSILSQLTGAVVGRGAIYYITLGSVLAALCLSANTSFVDFPRLCRLIAQDEYLPPGFAVLGRRLVYSIGIFFLAGCAGAILVAFGGITDRLIPLFAVGAFLAFTLSQTGMVQHWRKAGSHPMRNESAHGWRLRMMVNGLGAIATAVALLIMLCTKFVEGAWITVLAIPALLLFFKSVKRHYARLHAELLTHAPLDLSHNQPPIVLVPTRGWDKLTGKSLCFAMRLSPDVIALRVINPGGEEPDNAIARVRREWDKDVTEPCQRQGVPAPQLVTVADPYRRFIEPILSQIDRLRRDFPDRKIAVVIPEIIDTSWWFHLIHHRMSATLRSAIRKRGEAQVIVIGIPWYVEEEKS